MPTKNTKKNTKLEKDSVPKEPEQPKEAKIDVDRMHPKLRRLKKLSSREI